MYDIYFCTECRENSVPLADGCCDMCGEPMCEIGQMIDQAEYTYDTER